MRYTIWSHGRLVGGTDLAFPRVMDEMRSGWFTPTAEGERVLAVATATLPTPRAARSSEIPELPDIPEAGGSSHAADLAEAAHHLASLDLELRDEGGILVPTEDIGFRDTRALLEPAHDRLEGLDDLLEWEMDDDPELLFGGVALDALDDDDGGWREELGEPHGELSLDPGYEMPMAQGERFQVIVTLTDAASLP